MAYITSEQVAGMRKQIKEKYPAKDGWKFSIVRCHGSEIQVSILQAPICMTEKDYEQVNHYYIKDHYQGEIAEVLNTIHDIISKGNYDNSDYMTDYFNVGWYMSISIGAWDRHFKVAELVN